MECKHCGNTDYSAFFIEDRGNQKALICGKCGKWQKWVGKKDIRGILAMGVQIVSNDSVEDNQEKNNNIGNNSMQKNGLVCLSCGSNKFEKKQVSIHTGLYCVQCGRWIKWIKKG